MASFDWLGFVRKHHIEYVTSGPATAKGNAYVRCPFCRDPDPEKRYMGLSLNGPAWGCWKGHRGTKPSYLIQALLGCTHAQAEQEAQGDAVVLRPLDELRQALQSIGTTEDPEPLSEMPGEFAPITARCVPPLRYYYRYIQNRGFPWAADVAEHYDMRAAMSGRYEARLVVPFWLQGKLVGWTGRSIRKYEKLRYLSWFAKGYDQTNTLFNYDNVCATGGDKLVLNEGPWDTAKVDWFGQDEGIRALGLLGVVPGKRQVALVTEAYEIGRFREVVVMLDRKAEAAALRAASRLAHLPTRVVTMLDGYDDPGDLPGHRVVQAVG